MLTGLKNWIHRQLELLRFKQQLIRDNNEMNKLLNLKIGQILPNIEALDQSKLYYVIIEDPEHMILIEQFYCMLKSRLKWTAPYIILLEAELEELSEDKLQLLLKKVRANKIKG